MSGLRLVDDQTPLPVATDHRAELQAAIMALRRAVRNPLLSYDERELVDANADLLETTLSTTKEVA